MFREALVPLKAVLLKILNYIDIKGSKRKPHKPSTLRPFLLSRDKRLQPSVARILWWVILLLENVWYRYSKTESLWMTEARRKT